MTLRPEKYDTGALIAEQTHRNRTLHLSQHIHMYMHTQTHTHVHTYIHTYVRTYIHNTNIPTDIKHIHTITYTHAYIHPSIHKNREVHLNIYTTVLRIFVLVRILWLVIEMDVFIRTCLCAYCILITRTYMLSAWTGPLSCVPDTLGERWSSTSAVPALQNTADLSLL